MEYNEQEVGWADEKLEMEKRLAELEAGWVRVCHDL